ncbi:MAG: alpha/beta fold hydrolase [Sphingomonadales bacterium]|jgi:dipeptidyl aminopeptidase/acylaminoacyl peptidase
MKVFRTVIRIFLSLAAFSAAQVQAEMSIELQERRDGALRLFNVPEVDQSVLSSITAFQDNDGAAFLDWSDDGQMLIARRAAQVVQLFVIDAPGETARQISFSKQAVGRGLFAKLNGTKGAIFSSDQNGDESYQYYFQAFEGGEPITLTPQAGRNSNAVLSNSGRTIAYTRAQDQNGGIWGVIDSPLKRKTSANLVFQDPGAWAVLDWSPDDKKLLMLNFNSIHDSTLFIADVESGIKTPFDVSAIPKGYSGAKFSRDGKGVYFLSSVSDGLHRLTYLSFGGERHDFNLGLKWSITDFATSATRNILALVVNEGGVFKLQLRDLKTGALRAELALPKGQITNLKFSKNAHQLGFTLDAAAHGRGAYSLGMDGLELTRWDQDAFNTQLSEPELFSYPTFDKENGVQRQIPALIYKPKEPGPHPVIIRFHGGPEGQWVTSYSSTTQYWVNKLGLAVIMPNVRGSIGYGRDFAALDNEFKREDSLKDVEALLDWIDAQDDLDSSRIMVQGGSYGGYMTLASLVHFPDRLRGGIDSVGISNFVTFLESTGDFRRELRRVEYGDESDPKVREYLNNISPLTHAERIKQPLLIAQGANDPRVPESESRQMVNAIAEGGGVVWYVLAEDEGHGFERRANRDYFSLITTEFIKRYLLDGSPQSLTPEAE